MRERTRIAMAIRRWSATAIRPWPVTAILPCLAAVILLAAFATAADAQPEQDWSRTETRDDCLEYDALRNPYFGETHVHTAYSLDARFLKLRTDARDSYAFATGAASQDLPPYDAFDVATRSYHINRPLDFMAVTDHAEGFGENQICFDNSYAGYSSTLCSDLRDQVDAAPQPPGPIPAIFITFQLPLTAEDPTRFTEICGATNADCLAAASLVWQDTQDAAEEYYDRSDACSFTTFVGYEWTSQPGGDNLHRNVIFRNAEVQAHPITTFEDSTPEGLFDALDAECMDLPGNCEAITIPHNPNVSQGRMFETVMSDGSPMTLAYAEQRARIEPIVEMFQNKGSSECRPGAGSTDEQCAFESMGRRQNFGGFNPGAFFQPLSFVRQALKEGLVLKEALGVNPFQFGFIGSTDGHSNLPGAVNEQDFSQHGHTGATNSQPEYALSNININGIDANPGGVAVVWAEENSRDAIFEAMKRRETYATSGPRMVVRMFGGRMPKGLCEDPSFAAEGYARGVPMGGEIGTVKGSKSPTFAVMAQKDPGGNGDPSTPLQRIEIIKAWVDADGVRQEAVFHVAGDKLGKSDASVDLASCTSQGAGYDSLCGVWRDPKFKANEDATYYARVIENPVCRWHQYLCNAAAVDCSNLASVPADYLNCCSDNWPDSVQERAWTSPIFYLPEEAGVEKAQLKYGKNGGDDKLKMIVSVGKLDPDFDVGVNDLTIVLRDDDDFFDATLPAGTLTPVGNGTKFKYKDREGTIAGIKTALLKTSTKKATRLKLITIGSDFSAADASSHQVEMEISIGGYQSTDRTLWEFDGKRLRVPK
jgi:hypothetical protein